MRIFLRGRPVVVHAPAAVVDTYDLSKVSPAPHSRLKLEWVYPSSKNRFLVLVVRWLMFCVTDSFHTLACFPFPLHLFL